MSGIAITKDIRTQLLKNTQLTDKIGNKIFPIVADDGTTFPFILIKKSGMTTNYSKCGVINDVVNATIEVVDNNYSRAVELSEEIRNTIERNKFDNISNVEVVNVIEDYVSDSYIITQQYKIMINNQ